jgi:hypothetical protein
MIKISTDYSSIDIPSKTKILTISGFKKSELITTRSKIKVLSYNLSETQQQILIGMRIALGTIKKNYIFKLNDNIYNFQTSKDKSTLQYIYLQKSLKLFFSHWRLAAFIPGYEDTTPSKEEIYLRPYHWNISNLMCINPLALSIWFMFNGFYEAEGMYHLFIYSSYKNYKLIEIKKMIDTLQFKFEIEFFYKKEENYIILTTEDQKFYDIIKPYTPSYFFSTSDNRNDNSEWSCDVGNYVLNDTTVTKTEHAPNSLIHSVKTLSGGNYFINNFILKESRN